MLFEFLRDLAVLAAASGVAWWTWREYATHASLQDDAAKVQIAAERREADLMILAQRLEQQVGSVAEHVSALAAASQETDACWAAKVRVHALLQSTDDPFLSFSEIESALAEEPAAAGRGDGDTLPSGDRLRRVLIDLVGDGVVAQLDRDRYFIATDFEAGETSGAIADQGEQQPG